ncbi:MAG: SEL1-like repeat protein [Treponema sp.]|nr:SEL1-like repeat protein [Treponema sp.]
MELNYIEFRYEDTKTPYEDIKRYDEYCHWLGLMYKYYLKPVTTGKIKMLKVIMTDDMENTKKISFGRYSSPEEDIYLYVAYDCRNFQNRSVKDIQRTSLDIIHNRIMEYAALNDINGNNFVESYNTITANNFLFEEKYLEPASNGIYTAQMSFKYDFQDAGVFYDSGVVLEIYKERQLIHKTTVFHSALRVVKKCIHYIKWEDDANVIIDYFTSGDFYWRIPVNGTIELDCIHKSDCRNIFHLGTHYYYGRDIAKDEEKGVALIKKAAHMGSKSASEWLAYPIWRKIWYG